MRTTWPQLRESCARWDFRFLVAGFLDDLEGEVLEFGEQGAEFLRVVEERPHLYPAVRAFAPVLTALPVPAGTGAQPASYRLSAAGRSFPVTICKSSRNMSVSLPRKHV